MNVLMVRSLFCALLGVPLNVDGANSRRFGWRKVRLYGDSLTVSIFREIGGVCLVIEERGGRGEGSISRVWDIYMGRLVKDILFQ